MTDALLALYLLLVLPGTQMWRSLRRKDAAPPADRHTPLRKLLANLRLAGLPLAAMAIACRLNGYGTADLGLSAPASGAPLWCLIGAAIAALVLLAGTPLSERRMTPEKRAAYRARLRDMPGMPRGDADMLLFLPTVLLLGCGWELLYRAYLLLVLPPLTGMPAAIALSAIAYGAGHGYSNARQFILSIVSALLFALAYVASGSLWWLMLIHTALPLSAAISSWTMLRHQPRGDLREAV
ncbi:CPBP family intramembrane glutamic endopeptidase [Oxalobacteraceae bacterium A2-2]